jgi:hypothetical protein
MHTHYHRRHNLESLGHRRRSIAALSVSLLALSGAMGTASAIAGSSTVKPSVTPPVEVTGLPAGEVEKVLSDIPLSSLKASQLTEVLSKLPGLGALPNSQLKEALTTTIEGLTGKGGTLGQLTNPAEVVPKLEAELSKSIPLLGVLLKGSPTTKLTEALASLNASELVGSLLKEAEKEAKEPEKLIGQLLGALKPETLTTLLGTTLTGEPFGKTNVSELAGSLGITPEALAENLGKTVEQLPATATAFTGRLANKKTLGVFNGLGGVTLGTLGELTGGPEGGLRGPGGGKGGPGGSGGSGSTGYGAPGATTVVVTSIVPASSRRVASHSAAKVGKVGKVEIISHRIKGRTAVIVIQVPAAGKLSLRGGGVKAVSRKVKEPERLTLRVVLSRAGAASLRKHHRLRVRLTASFRPSGGSSSSAVVTVTFG